MWTYLKWALRGIVAAILLGILHYNLPHHDVVRLTDTYNRETAIGGNWMFYANSNVAFEETEQRDIRFIEAIRPNGDVSVYRNEDTGLSWPPYLKYGSTNLQAEASNLVSDKDTPQWVDIRYYGWRSTLLSIYPNALSVRPVAGPDAGTFPWDSVMILVLLALGAVMVVWLWRLLPRRVGRSFSRGRAT